MNTLKFMDDYYEISNKYGKVILLVCMRYNNLVIDFKHQDLSISKTNVDDVSKLWHKGLVIKIMQHESKCMLNRFWKLYHQYKKIVVYAKLINMVSKQGNHFH